ncbi:MAG: hypothetical protein QXO47_07075 [Thermoproteota archaeon]|nr:hypothetical protein [Candidatus Brockarchaeota archaeon]
MVEESVKEEKLQIDFGEAVKKIMEVAKHAEEEAKKVEKKIEQETKEHPVIALATVFIAGLVLGGLIFSSLSKRKD